MPFVGVLGDKRSGVQLMPASGDTEFVERIRDWLGRQGRSYKRAHLAQQIGISPRHLNNVLQGKRNLSPEARARALNAIAPSKRQCLSLRDWLKQKGMSVHAFANEIDRPSKTVEDWVYRGKMPSRENRSLVYSVTGLTDFSPSGLDKSAEETPASTPVSSTGGVGKNAVATFRRLSEVLGSLVHASQAERDWFRRQIPGPDIGYVRSALAALLDEELLDDWKRMSSYRPTKGGPQ